MLNAIFVVAIFVLQLNQDQLHINWFLGVKTNITFNEETFDVSKITF